MLDDLWGLFTYSLLLLMVTGFLAWCVPGAMIASKFGLSPLIGSLVSGLLPLFGFLGLVVWTRQRQPVTRPYARTIAEPGYVPSPARAPKPTMTSGSWWDEANPVHSRSTSTTGSDRASAASAGSWFDEDEPGASSADAAWHLEPTAKRFSGQWISWLNMQGALAILLAVPILLLIAAFDSPWLTFVPTGALFGDYVGGEHFYVAIPLAASIGVLLTASVLFWRHRQGRWPALVAVVSGFWLAIGAELQLATDAIDTAAHRITDSVDLPANVSVTAGSGSLFLLLAGGLGITWAIASAAYVHMGRYSPEASV